MEPLISILNFEEKGLYREINSPRTLEACLRTGIDPSELVPKNHKMFKKRNLTEEMIQIKAQSDEKKRLGNNFYT